MASRDPAIPPDDLEVVPATAGRWPDVVTLLGGGAERGCWCQAWRGTRKADGLGDDNRARLEAQVRRGAFAPGVIAYLGGEPVGWCQAWRGTRKADGLGDDNRARLEAQVRLGAFAPGVIAYLGSEPVGWCGLGPRAAMPRLVGSRTIPTVDDLPAWSIGCFVVRPGYRRRGVARALLRGAVAYARSQGAPVLEAYPIDPAGARVSGAFGFVGFLSTFEAAGFRRVVLTDARSAGLPRWLVRLDLR